MKKENSTSLENAENNNTKNKFVDDGRTVYDMSGLDDMHRTGPRHRRQDKVSLSRAERRALIRAALARYLPILFGVLACFALAALMLYFWLK